MKYFTIKKLLSYSVFIEQTRFHINVKLMLLKMLKTIIFEFISKNIKYFTIKSY